MTDSPAGNTWPPQNSDKPGMLTRFRAWLNGNKKFVYVPLLGLVLVIFGVWAKYDFTLDFSRFLAAPDAVGVDIKANKLDGPVNLPSSATKVTLSWRRIPPADFEFSYCYAVDNEYPGWPFGTHLPGGDGEDKWVVPVSAGQTYTFRIMCKDTSNGEHLWDDTVVVNVDGDAGPTATPTVTQCNDNIDNDGDGEYDFDGGPNGEPVDQSCADEADNDESDLLPTETPPEATATPTSTPEGTQLPGTSCAKVNFVAAVNTDGTATVKNNNNEPCTVHLTSYNIWKKRGGTPPHYLTAQTIFKTISRRLNAGQEATLSVELPACYSQIDLTRAPPMQPPTPNGGEDVLAFNFGPFSSGYCDDPQATAPPATATPTVCPATAPAGLNSLISTGNSLLLRWTPGTGSSFQQLRFGPNQAEVNSGCQASPTTCVAVENNLPATQNEYNIPAGRLTAGTTYYWRIVNLNQGPPVCFKDAAATYSAPGP
ncbi:MAG: hypothetical protein KW806_01435, partial [Candidatus Yanofskybacteria bacterium]|nr:hypothetical protein [Candidatus Yanofskybacteria bacterium]